MKIGVERDVSDERKDQLGVDGWSPWSKEESEFDWSYSDTETCYVFEGEVTLETNAGDQITIRAGDVAQFKEGLSCVWKVTSDLEKVFTFDDVSLNPDDEV